MQLQPILSFVFLMQASNILAAPEPQGNAIQKIDANAPNKELAQQYDNDTVLANACWRCGSPCSAYYCCNSLCATDGAYCYCLYP